MNQVQGGGSKVMSFGKSRAKRLSVDSPKITFRDVAGVDEAVEELHEIKEFLENPKKFQALGARIPKGVLLYGPPGTGKTLLARAVAGEAGDRAREQGLTGARWAIEQHALGDARSERLEFLGVLQELLDLVELLDRLVHPRDVAERDLRRVHGQALGAGFPEGHDLRA